MADYLRTPAYNVAHMALITAKVDRNVVMNLELQPLTKIVVTLRTGYFKTLSPIHPCSMLRKTEHSSGKKRKYDEFPTLTRGSILSEIVGVAIHLLTIFSKRLRQLVGRTRIYGVDYSSVGMALEG